jgi:3-methyladenine DNA glycosylase AlkD
MQKYSQLLQSLQLVATPARAEASIWYFKARKGEYGEGDLFLGVTVPQQRAIAIRFADLFSPKDLSPVLQSKFHEVRATGLFMLIRNFTRADNEKSQKIWVQLYLNHLDYVNNWDLVDSSAPVILGKWLLHRDRKLLYQMARSRNLWRNRIAILSTLAFIRENDFDDLLQLAKIFLTHPHDLMHKATGWMLREAWKRNPSLVEQFIKKNAHQMPRTMLRYAIEKMSPAERKKYLHQ